MPKASKSGYYAVRVGRVPGIYHSWADCEAQVKGFPDAMFKKLSTEAEVNAFMAAKVRPSATRHTAPVVSSSKIPNSKGHPSHSTARDPSDCDVVYCDGACKGNGQPGSIAGLGVWWGHGDPRNIAERCPGDQTNNRAELIAIVRVLETTPHPRRKLVIKTDSKYAIQCVTTWISEWTRNGFLAADGKPVKNRALIKYLAALLHVRQKTSLIEFEHVRGHVGIEGNEAADQLANLGATKLAVPERDWEKLEKEVLRGLKPINVVDDLKAYADGLLSDDEFAELAGDTSALDVVLPKPRPLHPERMKEAIGLISVSPPRTSVTETGAVQNKSQSSSKFTVDAVAPSKKKPISMSKEELEMYAACLLGNDELSTLGRDGVFDSDF